MRIFNVTPYTWKVGVRETAHKKTTRFHSTLLPPKMAMSGFAPNIVLAAKDGIKYTYNHQHIVIHLTETGVYVMGARAGFRRGGILYVPFLCSTQRLEFKIVV